MSKSEGSDEHMTEGKFEKLQLPDGAVLPLEYRVEASGMLKWRVRDPAGNPPDFIVTLLGANVSKVEELHRRRLNNDDIRGIVHSILNAQEHLDARLRGGGSPPKEKTVMILDTDLAELAGSKTTRVNDVP